MSIVKKIYFGIFLLLLIMKAGALSGQTEAQEQIPDTTDYAPYIYSDALEYNLLIAASKGYVSEVNRLIAMGADVDAETSAGVTPLIMAVASGKSDLVTAILEHNPDINKFTSLDETPLLIAVKNNYFSIAEKLIRANADVNLADAQGAAPLHYAVLYGYTDIADMLIYYDADVNPTTNDGSTPLLASVWAGSYLASDLLLKSGAQTEIKDNNGLTPFLLASWFGDTATMNLLYANGANISAVSNKGHNAMTLAIVSGQKETVQYLLKLGKEWKGIAQTASDPYLAASIYGRKDIIDLLHENNIPGKEKYRIGQISISLSERFSQHDLMSGFAISFREPLLRTGFVAGFDFKPGSTRVLIRNNNKEFHQYYDNGSLAYSGFFKDFVVKEYKNSLSLMVTPSIIAGFAFGNNLRGTNFTPENKLKLIPSVNLRLNYFNVSGFAGFEYIKTPFYKSGPVWFRIGLGYNYFLDNIRTRIRLPKWY